MTCTCTGPCRKPISHAQPTITNIDLPPAVERIGEKDPKDFSYRDKRVLARYFKP